MPGHEQRDRDLGAALGGLDVPEHRPEFWAEVDHRLASAERSRDRSGRRPRRAWKLLPTIAAAAAVVLVVAGVGVGGPDGSPIAPRTASAEEVRATLLGALAALTTLEADAVELDHTISPPAERRWRLSMTSAGDLRLTGSELDLSYDSANGVVRSVTLIAGATFASDDIGVAPGPPDRSLPSALLREALGSAVRALAGADDPRVTVVEHDGRPAWLLEANVEPNRIGASADHVAAVVDQASGLPLEIHEQAQGRPLWGLRLENMTVDGGIAPERFRLDLPATVEVGTVDYGFRRVGLEEVAGIVGYEPIGPVALPPGFRLAEVAVAERSQSTGREGGNPPSVDTVSLVYRRGFEQITVTTRRAGQPGLWDDPFATEGRVLPVRSASLATGRFAGSTAHTIIAPDVTPRLWGIGDGLMFTVAGDLPERALLEAAASLTPRGS